MATIVAYDSKTQGKWTVGEEKEFKSVLSTNSSYSISNKIYTVERTEVISCLTRVWHVVKMVLAFVSLFTLIPLLYCLYKGTLKSYTLGQWKAPNRSVEVFTKQTERLDMDVVKNVPIALESAKEVIDEITLQDLLSYYEGQTNADILRDLARGRFAGKPAEYNIFFNSITINNQKYESQLFDKILGEKFPIGDDMSQKEILKYLKASKGLLEASWKALAKQLGGKLTPVLSKDNEAKLENEKKELLEKQGEGSTQLTEENKQFLEGVKQLSMLDENALFPQVANLLVTKPITKQREFLDQLKSSFRPKLF